MTAVRTTLLRLGVVGAIVCAALTSLLFASPSSGAAGGAPYTDPASNGFIGLCNQAGQQITSGTVSAAPFVWRAVSSVSAPAPYNDDGRTAILEAYQPQQGLLPGEWSGEGMTASASYSNPAVPMAQATSRDLSLANFLTAYPARWDGFIQLRMYFGTINAPQLTAHYPSLNIQVTGSKWQEVGGGSVNCTAGTAESIETQLLPSTTTSAAPAATTTTAPKAGKTTTSTTAAKKSTSAAAGSVGTPGNKSGTSTTAIVVVVIAGILLAGGGAWLLLRRRSQAPGP